MFKKMVAIEPINVDKEYKNKLNDYSQELILYNDIPKNNEEIIKRIGDADAVLLSTTSSIDAEVLERCRNIKYIGMCCSLYSAQSANVDIEKAKELGAEVTGVRDYGDEGVAEYAVSELVRLLHGFGEHMWKEYPVEITDLNVGIIGMGTTGQIIAKALKFFGANIYYYSRTRKEDLEKAEGYHYLPLNELLKKVNIIYTCLNKNVVLLYEKEFGIFGNGNIIVNISIDPSHDIDAMKKWLEDKNNYFLCDMESGADYDGSLLELENVICAGKSSGMTTYAKKRLGRKVIENITDYLNNNDILIEK